MLVVVLGVVLGAVVVAAGWSRARRRARVRALRPAVPPGVLDERFVDLGGVPQWVSIRGDDADNPILLVLHGGPGASYTVFTPELRSWERHFTVVQWDRRGVGRTLGRNGREGCGALTFERMQEDCAQLRAVLADRLPGRSVILLASSAGTMVGLPLVRRRPDLFAAYVGTDFNVGLAPCEAVAGPRTLEWARAHASRRELAFLARLGADPTRWSPVDFDRLMRLRDRSAGEGRGIASIMLPRMMRSPLHSPGELLDLARGLSLSTRALFPEMVAFDADRVAPALDVPFYLFQGEADVFTPPAVARAYFERLAAPRKAFELLPGVGHLGAFVAPTTFLERLRRQLA